MKETVDKFNWPLIGNSHITDFLSRSITNNKLASAYIFLGQEDLGKNTIAKHFSRILLCRKDNINSPCGQCQSCLQFSKQKETIHGDLHIIEKEADKKNISVEQIREFIKSLGLSSFLNSYKIGIIKNAETLSEQASNALLKTLEEPKQKVIIILIATNMEYLPKTIQSRSQVFKFNPVKSDIIYDYLIEKHNAGRSMARDLSRISSGRPALAVKFLQDNDFYKKHLAKAEVFLNFSSTDINERIKQIEELSKGQTSSDALEIIEIWQSLARDMILLKYGHNDLLQYQVFNEQLTKNNFSVFDLLKISNLLQKSKKYLRANVNAKLVLENIAIL